MSLTAAFAGDLPLLFDTLWSAGVALAQNLRRTAAADCEVDIAVGADAVAHAHGAWRGLERDGGAPTPFQSFAMAQHLAQVHHARGDSPRIITVYEGGRPAVILPTVLTRWSGGTAIRFLGDPLIQYGDAIVAPTASRAALESAWRAAADPATAKLVYLRKVRADAHLATILARDTRTIADHHAPYIAAQCTASDAARNSRDQRRLRKKLQASGVVAVRHLQGHEAVPVVMEALTMKREWLTTRGLPSGVIGDPSWEQAIVAIARDDTSPLRAVHMTVDGKTAAIEIALRHGSHWCAFLGATSPAFARVGPGHAQMEETIAHCRSEGITTYDLLAPADPYKQRIANGQVAVRDHAVALTAWGMPGLWAARSLPAIKSLASQMPAHWRRRVMALRSS